MKLFGSYGKRHQKHNTDFPKSEHDEQKRLYLINKLFSFTRSNTFYKLKLPVFICGGIVLFVLLVLLIYSIWEKPPEVNTLGPVIQETLQPLVQKPVDISETPHVTDKPIVITPEPTQEIAEVSKIGRRENCYTFVLLAYDQMEANTDTVLVGNLDTDSKTLSVVNIPRDTLVNVSWGVKKLNSILANERNDPQRFLEHLGNLIGFTADFYAIIDIKAAEKLVDCIGGVYYNVPRDMDYDDPTQNLSIHISKGYQHLSGEDAVKVLRFRVGNNNSGYPNGDLGRINTQQDFLKSIADQFLTIGNVPNLGNAIDIFQSYVKTDLSSNNLAFLVREFLLLDKESINFSTMPGKGISIRGGSYFQANIDEWVSIVNKYLNPFYQVITADNLNILQENGTEGAFSTTGEIVPINSFYDFSQYSG